MNQQVIYLWLCCSTKQELTKRMNGVYCTLVLREERIVLTQSSVAIPSRKVFTLGFRRRHVYEVR